MYSPYRSASAIRHDSPSTMNGSPIPLVKSGSEDLDNMDPTVYFERGRIKQLQDERVSIQKKTFTKWCNSYLNRAHCEIGDLFTDLCDGILLLKLLEIISGDKLGKANRGRMRVHKIENLNRVLEYLKRKRIQLENIGAEDILDANPRLILGLIWTIILRFQIEDIEIEVDENESSEKKFAKDALLLWCQRKTAGYPCVKIENFTTSWRSGLGFNALIHAHRPDLINFNELSPNDHAANLNNAFEVAEKKLGIARLLDAEDIDVARPDEKSVITYVSMYYHYFAKQKSELTGAKRIAKVIWQLMNTDQMKQEYEVVASELLQWIRAKVEELSDRRFPNSLNGIQDEMVKFKLYRTQEKPAKYKEKGELEVLVFNIRTKQKALGTKQYVPPNGLLLHDIETAWNTLESAEHNRQVALHEELIRQERLEQLARNFERKAKLRESWLREMTLIVQDFEFGRTVSQVEANVKKHEAISADILPRENRFQGLKSMANELARENYHNRSLVRSREQSIWEKWVGLLKVLDSRRSALISLNKLMTILRDIDALSQEFEQIEVSLKSRDSGRHLLAVEDMLQKHDLLETQLMAHGKWLKGIIAEAQAYIRGKGLEFDVLQAKINDLQQHYENLLTWAKNRRSGLEHTRELYQFMQDSEEEGAWLKEKSRLCVNLINQTDPSALSQVHLFLKGLETEMQGHWLRTKQVLAVGEKQLLNTPADLRKDLQNRLNQLHVRWEELRQLVVVLNEYVKEAQQILQFYQDANEAESWITEKMPLVTSQDVGKDETSAESLLVRHGRLEGEIKAYREDINRLEEMAQELNRDDFLLNLRQQGSRGSENPSLLVLQSYSKDGFAVEKGEVVSLVKQVGADRYNVSNSSGKCGIIPASVVQTVKAVPKSQRGVTGDASDVGRRQQEISSRYRELISQAKTRRELLEDTIQSHRFYRECYEFETWAKQVEKALNEPISSEHMKARRRRFNNIVADMNGSGAMRLKLINEMAEDFVASGHSQSNRIKARQQQISDRWQALIRLKERKAADMDAAEGVAQFTEMCRETRTWILDKTSVLEEETEAKDLKGLQMLQRKHQNLERELRPVDDKMDSLRKLADGVVKAYPAEANSIRTELNSLNDMWLSLKERVNERRKALEDSQGLQMFQNVVQDLMSWMNKVKMAMTLIEKPVDVAEAEMFIERHCEVHSDIMAHKEELKYANELGQRLLSKGQRQAEVEKALQALADNSAQVVAMWQNKRKVLGEMLDLQLFNREADHIDAATKGHEAFLEINDVGDSVDAVEDLLKQHYQLENKLSAQNERVNNFALMSESLLKHKHPESSLIRQREKDVTKYRQAIIEKATVRRKALEDSLIFHQFKRNADELLAWIGEKMRIAIDDSHHSGLNLQRRLKKHEAFEAELRANEDRLNRLNKQGDDLYQAKNVKSEEVEATLRRLNHEWKLLLDHSAARGRRLQQAWEQRALNRILDDANLKLVEIEKELQSDDIGVDLRGIKQLIQKHSVLEQDVSMYAKKVQDIVDHAVQLANNGHYDAKRMLSSVQELNEKFTALQQPMKLKRSKLDRSLMLHQFNFDVECERQWIREKMPMASFQEYGRSLTDAVNLRKKHEQLESEVSGHQPVVDRVVAGGRQLISMRHFASDGIKQKCAILEEEWLTLKQACSKRKEKLAVAFLGHQFYAEAGEVESWMAEKRLFLSSRDIGVDENGANVLLARHKALQDEMKTYKGILQALNAQCNKLKEMNHADVKQIQIKQQELADQFKKLEELAEKRIRVLSDAVSLYEYLRESQDLEQWIGEQQLTASSEECGRDYEHLIELMGKFNDFKQRVKTGFERFAMCEASAQALLERNPPFAREVIQHRERLSAAWSALLDCIQARDQHLHDAEEIHRFNRDCSEAMSRISEKSEAIPRDLGKDMVAVKRLLRRHDAFENELVALEAQLQVIIDDSARLQDVYPGADAEHIARREREVLENWTILQEKVVGRRCRLSASYDLQFFMAKARDFIQWTQEVIADLRSVQPVRDLQSAELLDASHQQLHAEIEARAESKHALQEMAAMMCSQKHYAEKEIVEKSAQVDAAHEEVLNEWKRGHIWIGQLILLHTFLREAKQIVGQLNRCGVSLNSEIPDSVEGVSVLMRKQEMFEKKLNVLEDRVLNLKNEADKLLQAKHPESKNIQRTYSDTEKRWRHLLQKNDERKAALKDALLYANFKSDIVEVESWIDDRFKSLTMNDEQNVKSTSLQEKMKRLQKHQTIEAELVAHEQRIRQINQNANCLLKQGHVSREEVVQLRDMIYGKWAALGKACQEQSRALEEARDILLFEQMIDRISSWMRATELMVNSGDMAEDYEHCVALLKKLSDAEVEASVDDETLKKITAIGEKLVSMGRTDKEDVQKKLKELQSKWITLHASLTDYRKQLESAKEVHAFRRDVNDTLERIAEKYSMVIVEEQVRDLPSVELLFRNQENVERDMTVIGEKIEAHRRDAAVLLPKDPPLKQLVVEGLQQLEANWLRLERAARDRKTRLQAAHELLKFFDCTRELESWSSNMMSKLTSHNMPHTVHESQCLLEAHKERKAEILGRREQFQQHDESGSQLHPKQPQHKKAIIESMGKLKQKYSDLLKKWEEENARLWRWYEFQYFSEQACQVDSWLATKEAFLNRDNPGNSLDEVDKLLKQHERFETTLRAQSDKMDKLTSAAEKLSKEDPENVGQIVQRRSAATVRYDRVLKKCDMRRALLNDSRKWHLFLKTCYDMMNWINQKLQIAYDESYLDSTNLQNKLRKHSAFDAELKANEPRIAAIEKEAEALIAADHFAKSDITLQVKEITDGWEELKKASSMKSERLEEAFSAYQFSRRVNDLDKWIDNVESQLSSDDHGTDLFSVENLLKRHELLEEEIAARKVDFGEIDQTAKTFISRHHFLADDIEEKATSVGERYASLREPCEIRKENLTDAHRLYQWLHSADEQSAWLREHRPTVFNEYLGESLQSAQNLLKKHQLVEQKFAANEDTFRATSLAGERMIESGHFAASTVRQRLDELCKELDSFRDQMTIRRLKLFDAVEVQQYLCDAFEAEEWIRGRQAVLSSEDVGQDEEVVLGALKKLEQVEQDILNYKGELDKLSKSARAMLERRHFDEAQIAAKQSQLERDYGSLMNFCQDRRQRLTDARRYYQYLRQADNLIAWLREKEAAAMSEDYGRDLEHCQVLITNFEQFLRELSAAGERVASVQRVQDDLLRSNHPFSASIKAKGADLQKLWCDVNEAATDRQQALLGARQVHKFDQDADETLNWLQEKEAQIVSESDDVCQSDLMTIQTQLQRNDIFMRELSAVERQVESLCKEAERLVSLYPDTQKHLDVRKQEMLDVLADVKQEGNRRLQKLRQAEEFQTYFDDYHDLMNWINEMHTVITSEGLARDVLGAEAQVVGHKEHFAEIEARRPIVQNFIKLGREMMRAKHLLSNEISGKVERLEGAFDRLRLVWEERNSLYAMNLDAQLWKRDAAALEVWLSEREVLLEDDWRRVESVSAVEEKIRQFDDFLTTLSAQDDKFEALKKLTLLEQAFKNQIKREDDLRRQEEVTREKMRKDKIKTLEKHKILQERRQERERRRTQEITLIGTSLNESDRSADMSTIKRRSSFASPSSSVLRYESGSLDNAGRLVAAGSDDGLKSKPAMSIVSSSEDGADADISMALDQSDARRKRFSLDSSGLDSSGKMSSGFSALAADQPIGRRRSCDSESSDAMSKRLVAKKMPTFTTRRATGYRRTTRVMDMMQSIEKDGYIERKQDLQCGGKKATIRSWKSYYTILCGQLICFFKDQDNFYDNMAAAPPINILRAVCQPAFDYQKRKNTFKLRTSDGAEFLFACPSPSEMEDWIAKISFHAALPPSLQLKSFSERHSMATEGSVEADGRFRVPLPYVDRPTTKGHQSQQQQRLDSGYGTPFHVTQLGRSSSAFDSEPLRIEKIRPVITSSPTSGSLGVIQEEMDDNALSLRKGGRSEVVRKASLEEVDAFEQAESQDELSRIEQFNVVMRSQAGPEVRSSSTLEPDGTSEPGLFRRSSELASSSVSMDSEDRRRRRLPRIGNLFKGKKRDSFQL